jgi:FMN-dependent NADH-azoreductase
MKNATINVLHIDASARPGRSDTDLHGSHTRRLSARFVECWRKARPADRVDYLDVGQHPPAPVDGRWIHAAFTPPAAREPWMAEVLAESDRLVDQLLAADLIVVGLPMYNFSAPAQFKAWIDNIVRVGRTFGFDRSRGAVPYWPMLADAGKRAVLLGARGDHGYDPSASRRCTRRRWSPTSSAASSSRSRSGARSGVWTHWSTRCSSPPKLRCRWQLRRRPSP